MKCFAKFHTSQQCWDFIKRKLKSEVMSRKPGAASAVESPQKLWVGIEQTYEEECVGSSTSRSLRHCHLLREVAPQVVQAVSKPSYGFPAENGRPAKPSRVYVQIGGADILAITVKDTEKGGEISWEYETLAAAGVTRDMVDAAMAAAAR